MKKYLFIIFVFIINSTQIFGQSIKLGVEQTVQIPVEYVTILAGVTERGENASTVEKQGYERTSRVVSFLTDSGFEQEKMEINSGEIVQTNYRREEVFKFNSTVIFDVFELDKVDSLRRALTRFGATNFQIRSYQNTKEKSIYNEAYQNAIQQAKEHAELLLANERVKPGKILNLHENIQSFAGTKGEVHETIGEVPINIGGDLALDMTPLFNKEFYTKKIVFNVEFELIEK